jgi:cytochrome c-type biogenesis protein CcmH/NrfF
MPPRLQSSERPGRFPDLFLLRTPSAMRTLWLIPISVLAVGASLLLRARRRRKVDVALTTGPVSADWLAYARGHEEQEW